MTSSNGCGSYWRAGPRDGGPWNSSSGAAAAAGADRLVAVPCSASQEKVLVGKLKDLPSGSALTATYIGQPVIVFNVDGRVDAFSAICNLHP